MIDVSGWSDISGLVSDPLFSITIAAGSALTLFGSDQLHILNNGDADIILTSGDFII